MHFEFGAEEVTSISLISISNQIRGHQAIEMLSTPNSVGENFS
jgi:hypothetical protein